MDIDYNHNKEFLHFIPQNIGEAIVVTNLEANIMFINSIAEELTSYFKEDVINKNIFQTLKISDENSRLVNLDKEKRNKEIIKYENWSLITKTGNKIFISGSVSPMKKGDEIIGLIFIVFNITKQRIAEENLQFMSMHDALTGLYNRLWFEKNALHLSEKEHVPLGVIVCDLDGLKIINDSMGHKSGDEILKTAAKVLKESFDTNMIARIGGDEFVILLPKCSEKIIKDSCIRVKNNIDKHNEIKDELPLSISTGYSISDKLPLNIAYTFQEADSNMYREKLHNKKTVRGAITKAIMNIIKEKDFMAEGHCNRVKHLAELIGYSLGFPEDRINDLRLLAEFHDIGKISVPQDILIKKGPLTDIEVEEMKSHCEKGQQIASSLVDLSHIAHFILKHHEWWNGSGYPLGLKEESIPLECRILSIVNAYDAMIYRKLMTQDEAIEELKKGMGTKFDTLLVSEFIRLLKALKIYVASSLKNAITNIRNDYINNNPSKEIFLRFDASGTLKKQIENGSIADIFIAAASRPMDELQIKSLIINNSRENLLYNRMVLITSKKSKIKCTFKELDSEEIKQIAIGDPKIVPVGKYAHEVLKSLGLLEAVKSKLIVAKSACDVLNYVEEANIDVGIVYLTDAIVSDKVNILDFAHDKLHSPVIYPIAIMKNTDNETESKDFIEYLKTSNAIEIFNKYGFIFPKKHLNRKVIIDLLAGNF